MSSSMAPWYWVKLLQWLGVLSHSTASQPSHVRRAACLLWPRCLWGLHVAYSYIAVLDYVTRHSTWLQDMEFFNLAAVSTQLIVTIHAPIQTLIMFWKGRELGNVLRETDNFLSMFQNKKYKRRIRVLSLSVAVCFLVILCGI